MKMNTSNLIFAEDLDYSKTSDVSIWGDGDPDTIEVLKQLTDSGFISGSWLNFAAGDGRYNNILLTSADAVVATDIDQGALDKLRRVTPKHLADKLTTQVQNITETFPYEDSTFEGCFNTGTLHLFPVSVLETLISEVARVLKPSGMFLFDFATDVKRIKADGNSIAHSESMYKKDEAKQMLIKMLKKNKFSFTMYESSVSPEQVITTDGTYMFSCNYLLIVATKDQ